MREGRNLRSKFRGGAWHRHRNVMSTRRHDDLRQESTVARNSSDKFRACCQYDSKNKQSISPSRPHKTETAREMRRNMTEAEVVLWSIVRGRRLGFRFRRQQPIGPYIVDFYCSAAKLIAELDGYHHGDEERNALDRARTCWLEANGFEVLRFWNVEFFENRNGVVEAIERAVRRRVPALTNDR